MLPVEDISVAPICQRGGLSVSTTTAAASTTETTETTTTPECPDGWESYTGDGSAVKCFKYFRSAQYATDAEESCQALGGHLASIHSIEEQNFITQMFESPIDGVWAGGVDFNHNGVWGWTDGTSFDFTNWRSGQPGGGEYYLHLGDDNGIWNWRDWEYYNDSSYICQITM